MSRARSILHFVRACKLKWIISHPRKLCLFCLDVLHALLIVSLIYEQIFNEGKWVP